MEKLNVNTDTQQLMTYYRQGISSSTTVLPSISEVPNARELTLSDRRHDILNFLQRPIDVFKGNWTVGNAQNSELIPTGISFPDVLYQNPQYQEKMRGFVGFKGNIRARLIINAQKFQQGVLAAYWIPNYDNLTSKAALIRSSLSGKTGCAHVFINCEGGTEQTIDIPYVNQHTYYNSTTNQGNYGRLFLTPLLPLKSSTANDFVGVRIQVWVENPQLEFATSILPVLSNSAPQKEEESMHDNTINMGAGSGLRLDDVIDEIKGASMKPSYLAHSAGNLMQLAGFQKPTNQTAINRTSLRTNSFMANFNGEHMAHSLSLAANNELMGMDAPAGSTADEMNITNIAKAPTYYKTFTVDPLNQENYILFVDTVHPIKFVPDRLSILNSTFVGYVGSAFSQWRGSMKYNFVIGKTMFHSGTLRCTYIPGLYDTAIGFVPDPTNTKYQFDRCYQETFDLRDLTEFSFTCPYVSTRPFLNCVNPFTSAQSNIATRNYASGMIIVDVFIPVRAPETVTQTFEIAVFVSAGDDINFANPTAPPIYPYSPVTNVQLQGLSYDEDHDRVQAMQASPDIVGGGAPKMSLDASALCTGEVITSIKNLLGRFGPFYFAPAVTTAVNAYTIAPYNFQAPISSVSSTFTFDYIDYFSFIYGFTRGKVRITMDPGGSDHRTSNTWHIQMRSSLGNFYPTGDIPRAEEKTIASFPPQLFRSPFALAISRPSIEGTVDVEVPYYSLSQITPVLVKTQSQELVEESNYPFPLVTFFPYNANTTHQFQPRFYRAASDDFRFMYLLGPPQVTLLESDILSSPIQNADVIYTPQTVTRVENDFRGLFGNSSAILPFSPGTVQYDPTTQFIAVNAAANIYYCMPYNLDYSVSNSNDRVALGFTGWPLLTSAFLVNAAPVVSAGNFDNCWAGYALVPATTVAAQASPQPLISFSSVAITVDGSNISIPTQGIAVVGLPFALTNPLLIANGPTQTDIRGFTLLARNRQVFIRAFLDEGTIQVFSLTDERLGWIIMDINSAAQIVGFVSNTPTFSPTNNVPLVVP